jgi:hypothetical protein
LQSNKSLDIPVAASYQAPIQAKPQNDIFSKLIQQRAVASSSIIAMESFRVSKRSDWGLNEGDLTWQKF